MQLPYLYGWQGDSWSPVHAVPNCLKSKFIDTTKQLRVSYGGKIHLVGTGRSSKHGFLDFSLTSLFFSDRQTDKHPKSSYVPICVFIPVCSRFFSSLCWLQIQTMTLFLCCLPIVYQGTQTSSQPWSFWKSVDRETHEDFGMGQEQHRTL